MKTSEAIDFEISLAKTHRQTLSILLSLIDSYNFDYTISYEKWIYYNDLIAHPEYMSVKDHS